MRLKECEHNRKECELHAELQSFEGLYLVFMRICVYGANMEGKNFILQPGVHFEEYINYSKENKE